MSWTSRCRELIAAGMTEKQAIEAVRQERLAAERHPEPPTDPLSLYRESAGICETEDVAA